MRESRPPGVVCTTLDVPYRVYVRDPRGRSKLEGYGTAVCVQMLAGCVFGYVIAFPHMEAILPPNWIVLPTPPEGGGNVVPFLGRRRPAHAVPEGAA